MTLRIDDDTAMERLIADWLQAESPGVAPSGLERRVVEQSATLRQRRAWMRLPSRRTTGGMRWRGYLAAALVVALAVGAVAAFGGRILDAVGTVPVESQPVASPTPGPSPSDAVPSREPGISIRGWTQGDPIPGDVGREDPPPDYVGDADGSILALRYASRPIGGAPAQIDVWAYDPASGTWADRGPIDARVALLGSGAFPLSLVAARGDLYLIGYDRALANPELIAWRIDGRTLQGTGSGPAPFPGPPSVLGRDGRIYVADTAGYGTTEQEPELLRIYDPATDSWSVSPAMPTGRADGVPVAHPDGSIWIVGGTTVPVWATPESPVSEPLRSFARYDPPTGTWTESADLPVDLDIEVGGFAHPAAIDADGVLHVVGLSSEPPPGQPSLEVLHVRLDLTTWAWSVERPPEPFTPGAVFPTSDGRLVVFGSRVYPSGIVIDEWGLHGPQVTWIRDLDRP